MVHHPKVAPVLDYLRIRFSTLFEFRIIILLEIIGAVFILQLVEVLLALVVCLILEAILVFMHCVLK